MAESGFDLTLLSQRFREVAVITCLVRTQRDGFLDQGNCQVESAALVTDDAEQLERIGVVGLFKQDSLIDQFRLIQLTRPMMLDGLSQV
jgi:hypothetical protein